MTFLHTAAHVQACEQAGQSEIASDKPIWARKLDKHAQSNVAGPDGYARKLAAMDFFSASDRAEAMF